MNTITFDRLLLKTAFCCMASDGKIDSREIAIIKSLCETSHFFKDFKYQEEINQLVAKINERGKSFIQYYFDVLKDSDLTEQDELTLIDFAIQTIKADDEVEYSEIKFFKNIRNRLKVSDEKILELYPDVEMFLESDIVTESYLDKITKQYFDVIEIPQFDFVMLDDDALSNNI